MRSVLFLCFLAPMSFAQDGDAKLGERTKTVVMGLEKHLNKPAKDITAADIAGITTLELPHIHIPNFNENDFAGMPKLKKLHFYSLFHVKTNQKDRVVIGDKVFAKLSTLEELIMTSDQYGALPDDVFAGLTSLKILDMTNASMTRVPKSMLTLPKLEVVYFDGQGLSKEDFAALQKALGDKLKPKREPKAKD